jgi:hypothetical protein
VTAAGAPVAVVNAALHGARIIDAATAARTDFVLAVHMPS